MHFCISRNLGYPAAASRHAPNPARKPAHGWLQDHGQNLRGVPIVYGGVYGGHGIAPPIIPKQSTDGLKPGRYAAPALSCLKAPAVFPGKREAAVNSTYICTSSQIRRAYRSIITRKSGFPSVEGSPRAFLYWAGQGRPFAPDARPPRGYAPARRAENSTMRSYFCSISVSSFICARARIRL
jgi:hypothetical protein